RDEAVPQPPTACAAPRRCSRAAGGAELYKQGGPLPRVPAGHHCAQVNEPRASCWTETAWRSPCSTSGSARTPPTMVLCSKQLSAADLEQLRTAVEDLYYFEFVVDDIPVRGFVGHLEETGFVPHSHKVFLWTHFSFRFYFSGPAHRLRQGGHAQEKAPVDLAKLQPGSQVAFTYSVAWVKSDVKFRGPGQAHQGHTLEIHWLSVINSLILVLLLIGFVTVIPVPHSQERLRQGTDLEDEEADEDSDNGWKTVHNDAAKHKCFFSATIGVGAQFLAIITGLFVMALLGLFNVHTTTANIKLRRHRAVTGLHLWHRGLRVLSNALPWSTGAGLLLCLWLFLASRSPSWAAWPAKNARARPGRSLSHKRTSQGRSPPWPCYKTWPVHLPHRRLPQLQRQC
uniref:Transmembrane 9 superfamily member n=1 Tax=Macrostomum lignano TaxID=282301 RepID=A0A1I8FN85_9PLAT